MGSPSAEVLFLVSYSVARRACVESSCPLARKCTPPQRNNIEHICTRHLGPESSVYWTPFVSLLVLYFFRCTRIYLLFGRRWLRTCIERSWSTTTAIHTHTHTYTDPHTACREREHCWRVVCSGIRPTDNKQQRRGQCLLRSLLLLGLSFFLCVSLSFSVLPKHTSMIQWLRVCCVCVQVGKWTVRRNKNEEMAVTPPSTTWIRKSELFVLPYGEDVNARVIDPISVNITDNLHKVSIWLQTVFGWLWIQIASVIYNISLLTAEKAERNWCSTKKMF